MQTTSDHVGRVLESREDVPVSPRHSMAPAFAHRNGDEMLHHLGENETILKQFWLFMAKSWTRHILQGCTIILVIDHCTSWYGIVKHRSILLKNFQNSDWAMQFSFSVMFGHTIQHSVSAEGQMTASITHHPLKMWSRNPLSSFLQCCRWVVRE